mmetsp:Transcript_17015/g.24076  ORF Transcript_17015/g.24076 Transcript_17015/m.24076 type:complete len:113 (+) Transcript_17015:175-513(+)
MVTYFGLCEFVFIHSSIYWWGTMSWKVSNLQIFRIVCSFWTTERKERDVVESFERIDENHSVYIRNIVMIENKTKKKSKINSQYEQNLARMCNSFFTTFRMYAPYKRMIEAI